jgi:hypothetical protein
MRLHSTAFTAVAGASLAALCFVFCFELTATNADSSADGIPSIPDPVNRALKGDRLRVIIRPPDAAPFESGPARALPDGCEPAIARVKPSTRGKLAQSCVT